jgi:hypothetical protein
MRSESGSHHNTTCDAAQSCDCFDDDDDDDTTEETDVCAAVPSCVGCDQPRRTR